MNTTVISPDSIRPINTGRKNLQIPNVTENHRPTFGTSCTIETKLSKLVTEAYLFQLG